MKTRSQNKDPKEKAKEIANKHTKRLAEIKNEVAALRQNLFFKNPNRKSFSQFNIASSKDNLMEIAELNTEAAKISFELATKYYSNQYRKDQLLRVAEGTCKVMNDELKAANIYIPGNLHCIWSQISKELNDMSNEVSDDMDIEQTSTPRL